MKHASNWAEEVSTKLTSPNRLYAPNNRKHNDCKDPSEIVKVSEGCELIGAATIRPRMTRRVNHFSGVNCFSLTSK
jgi:hypothetical protein